MKRTKTSEASPQATGQPVNAAGMPDFHLRPGMAANAAVRLILRHLLDTMRANEDGIRADADIEFLHEYRVAIRRTRSVLGRIRNVFPTEKASYFKHGFQKLGCQTNELRNLDVFLMNEGGYRSRLPDDMREDITLLFDYLRSRRSGTLAVVVTRLESKPYCNFLAEWDHFLIHPIGEDYPRNAQKPIMKVARRCVDRQYHAILLSGVYALNHPDDEVLHTLRIECKKLRYLLESFDDLFPSEESVPLLKQLKHLQDNLGAVSDLDYQRGYLYSIAEGIDIDGSQTRRALVATGFLIEVITREQQSTRADFAEIYKSFASPTNQKRFQKMMK